MIALCWESWRQNVLFAIKIHIYCQADLCGVLFRDGSQCGEFPHMNLCFFLVYAYVICVKFILSAFCFTSGGVVYWDMYEIKGNMNIINKLSAFSVSISVEICHQYLILGDLVFFSLIKSRYIQICNFVRIWGFICDQGQWENIVSTLKSAPKLYLTSVQRSKVLSK